MYIDFFNCQKNATELLAKQKLRSSKINVMKLLYDKNIFFYSIQDYTKTVNKPITDFYQNGKLVDGYTIILPEDSMYIVLYNKELCKSRINWTIAHEIGHIYMGHTQDTEKEEIEAHFFAAQLIMPEYVIYKMECIYGEVSVNDILGVFYVSKDAAIKRINTFERKSYYSDTKDDCHIWDMLSDNVNEYYKIKNSKKRRNPLIYTDNSREIFNSEYEWLYGFQ
ncbi:ImmA/IrrE family metallo-endopeptidase [Anaerosporobacter faecicola]|uniref:ImmA/IrrE family metallo-endopeptidase n=1 Tax=Anaerosporobacter faecicola TaxID=2718714 RepID=UPI001EE53382|nr:ImmA/IrrE family metallo-endopeptidase [Anaerosporobacter faecicola]